MVPVLEIAEWVVELLAFGALLPTVVGLLHLFITRLAPWRPTILGVGRYKTPAPPQQLKRAA
jgi:hypothetical protein